ncbi:hypothetical protein ACIRQP_37635 [Streptomyces sp. NPDC102274]|uniref:hypothetical protein n=1 Tax=Streptomyces sp. NPDC102274 TaxID=3366151 RepID=UPI00381F0663
MNASGSRDPHAALKVTPFGPGRGQQRAEVGAVGGRQRRGASDQVQAPGPAAAAEEQRRRRARAAGDSRDEALRGVVGADLRPAAGALGVRATVEAARTSEIPRHAATRPDLPGQLLAVASLVALTASLTMPSTLGWSSPLVLGLLAVAVALGACFVVTEHRVSEPMLPPALFRSSAFSGATGVGLLFNFGLYGVLFCITIFLERTLRQSAAVTGVALLPLTAVTALGALFSGRVTSRFGPRLPMALGLSGGLLGTCLLAACGDHSGTVALAVFGAITGCVGLCMPAMTGVALAGLRPQQTGLGAATLNAARQTGERSASPCSAAPRCSGPVRQARTCRTCGCHDPRRYRLPDRHHRHPHRDRWPHKATSVITDPCSCARGLHGYGRPLSWGGPYCAMTACRATRQT